MARKKTPGWQRTFDKVDVCITSWLKAHGVRFLQMGLAVVFIWFGILKPLGVSPAADLVARTVYWGVDPEWFVPFLGWWEVVIGLCLLHRSFIRLGIFLMAFQMAGTFLPLILLPHITWQAFPFILSMEGQYIIKNLVLIGAAMVVGSHVRDQDTTLLGTIHEFFYGRKKMVLLKSAKKLQPGDIAPEFSLKNVDETMISPSLFAGKVLVVIFMCNHCPYVKPKMDEISAIQNDYAGKAVVIGINANDPAVVAEDDFEHMKALAKEKGYKYYLIDETGDTARAYGATCTPDPFVFDAEHKLVYHGRINNQMEPGDPVTEHTMRNVLDKVIAGENLDNWFVPSQGCSIKWRK